MNSTILLQKLVEIERSIGVESDSDLRRKVLDAEECLLQMHSELVERLRANEGMTTAQRFSLLREFSTRREPEEA